MTLFGETEAMPDIGRRGYGSEMSSRRIFVGIDPGKGGGIAAVSQDRTVVMACRMPETERELLDALMSLQLDGTTAMAVLEKVHSSPQMGVKSAFTFGEGFGMLRMALAAARIPFETVVPNKWQRDMSCQTRGDKNVTKQLALSMFPNVKVTHALADALILSEWLRRRECR